MVEVRQRENKKERGPGVEESIGGGGGHQGVAAVTKHKPSH